MMLGFKQVGLTFAGLVLASAPLFGAGKTQTLTGQVSDAMCGVKHEMQGTAAQCTRDCVQHGSKYALIVDDKVYTLDGADKKAQDALDKLAGQNAKVTGTVDGTTVQVASVAPGK